MSHFCAGSPLVNHKSSRIIKGDIPCLHGDTSDSLNEMAIHSNFVARHNCYSTVETVIFIISRERSRGILLVLL